MAKTKTEEGIVFDPLGTVDVTFDAKTYHLGRPKMRQFKHFTEALARATIEVTDEMARLQDALDDATAKYGDNEDTPEAQAVIDDLRERIRAFNRQPFYEHTTPIVAEMFEQLGDPLPDDPDDWPAWLAADHTLPGEILKHWRNHPKVSGASPAT